NVELFREVVKEGAGTDLRLSTYSRRGCSLIAVLGKSGECGINNVQAARLMFFGIDGASHHNDLRTCTWSLRRRATSPARINSSSARFNVSASFSREYSRSRRCSELVNSG